jgi:hypothetical protein
MKVSLMEHVDPVRAALEAHKVSAAVVEQGLGLLKNLAAHDGNKVCVLAQPAWRVTWQTTSVHQTVSAVMPEAAEHAHPLG